MKITINDDGNGNKKDQDNDSDDADQDVKVAVNQLFSSDAIDDLGSAWGR